MTRGFIHTFKIRHPTVTRNAEGQLAHDPGTDVTVPRGRLAVASGARDGVKGAARQSSASTGTGGGVTISNTAWVPLDVTVGFSDLVVVDLGDPGLDGIFQIVTLNRTRAHTRLGLRRYAAVGTGGA